jgi:hypothetical protein
MAPNGEEMANGGEDRTCVRAIASSTSGAFSPTTVRF